MIYRALQYLKDDKEDFLPFHSALISNVMTCFEMTAAEGDEDLVKDAKLSQLVEVLTSFATTGFAPLRSPNEEVATLLSRNHVAEVVSK